MAPKATKKRSLPSDPHGIFAGMVVFLVESGVQSRRLQIWKQKLGQMGAIIEDSMSKRVTHVFAMDSHSLLQQLSQHQTARFKGNVLLYQWLENSLRLGERVAENSYILEIDAGGGDSTKRSSEDSFRKHGKDVSDETSHSKKMRTSSEGLTNSSADCMDKMITSVAYEKANSCSGPEDSSNSQSPGIYSPPSFDAQDKTLTVLPLFVWQVFPANSSVLYSPPDLNRTITEIFGKLINIYRALGDDRRSFSYHKVIPVIEKLPFKIESEEQVKHLPGFGKSMKDHRFMLSLYLDTFISDIDGYSNLSYFFLLCIPNVSVRLNFEIQEIVTTGKLSKLEHFETDEKVRTVSLFGEVWGIGPATALRLYEKGCRTLEDLENEDSLTNAQRLGLKYFDDIKARIPRHEVQDMELLLQKAGEEILPGVSIVCGGSFRRGKVSCGDIDIVVTHPDGKRLFTEICKVPERYEDTDSGVDTYFGLCTYPGRELRHRIDLKVYPRDMYPFALVHWTGNDVVNRRLRILAASKGFRLDDKGLYPATQGSGGKREAKGESNQKWRQRQARINLHRLTITESLPECLSSWSRVESNAEDYSVLYWVTFGLVKIWKQKLAQMGTTIEQSMSKRVTHVFALDSRSLLQQFSQQEIARFKGDVLPYRWLEDSLRLGEKVSKVQYILKIDAGGGDSTRNSCEDTSSEHGSNPSGDERSYPKKRRTSLEGKSASADSRDKTVSNSDSEESSSRSSSQDSSNAQSPGIHSALTFDAQHKTAAASDTSFMYSPPDLNRNITEIFGKLINVYRALGDDRRSFSYYKAIPVIEKLPFKIESVEQVKHLPGIGKSMQEHIQEIVSTGKLSKLEHFETDEKVSTISLFGEVWGIGPATALKLFEKGYRTLEDLKHEDSLTNSQRLGVKYFDDIKTRIPRHEVQEMELLLQKAGEDILPGVQIVCGGSFRRGKASCGDMDMVITHPDGKSHVGFLQKYVKHLKDMKFLREDLVFSTHSEEGTDSGVDTYYGLCTYPGRELRHRIDFKVYPRDIYAFGLIAWTGNDVLNRRLRLLAESKGFRLDDKGLFPATHGSGHKGSTRGTVTLKFATEREVFDFLGFPWLEPHERNL
ncbi:hypothetical protein RJ640_029476 [Escallonia rubra]|uniref:DNA polymerase lambda n=1 Tax=Escallonia rubra TaxID=112253 RepID=A0AA88RDK2_9ASTE|nr:hypothetical protein RJ640_029476 [Escallonia rubra]